MDKLKNYIDSHSNDFRFEDLPQGHLNRFCDKLQQSGQPKQRSFRHLIFALSSAACLACLLLLPKNATVVDDNDPFVMTQNQIKVEMNEVHEFYSMQINSLIAEIENVCTEQNLTVSQEIIAEAKIVLSDTKTFENNVMPNLPLSQDALNTINCHYSTVVECLSYMLSELQVHTCS